IGFRLIPKAGETLTSLVSTGLFFFKIMNSYNVNVHKRAGALGARSAILIAMDSRSNLFIVVTTVLLAILIVGGVVVENLTRPEVTAPDESAVPPQESVNTQRLFTQEAQIYDDVAPPQELPIVDDTASSEPNTNAVEPEPATTT